MASIILPEGILDLFEVIHVEEEHTGNMDETGTEVRVIHIYLDERDLREEEWHDLQPNGFTEPRKMIVIDCFHIIKRVCDGMDEMRMRFKRKATSGQKKEEREFNRKKALRKKARAYYRKRHPRKKGEKRGRPSSL